MMAIEAAVVRLQRRLQRVCARVKEGWPRVQQRDESQVMLQVKTSRRDGGVDEMWLEGSQRRLQLQNKTLVLPGRAELAIAEKCTDISMHGNQNDQRPRPAQLQLNGRSRALAREGQR